MENNDLLQGKLASIGRGAAGFRVVAIVFTVIAWIVVGTAGLFLLKLLGPTSTSIGEVLTSMLSRGVDAAGYFVLAWLSRRAADAFDSIGALIREMAEIV